MFATESAQRLWASKTVPQTAKSTRLPSRHVLEVCPLYKNCTTFCDFSLRTTFFLRSDQQRCWITDDNLAWSWYDWYKGARLPTFKIFCQIEPFSVTKFDKPLKFIEYKLELLKSTNFLEVLNSSYESLKRTVHVHLSWVEFFKKWL